MQKRRIVAPAALVAMAALTLTGNATAAVHTDTAALRGAVTVGGIMEHLDAFQAIADANGGNRASGQPGYDASVAYVTQRLEAAGYTVTPDPFDFLAFEELAAPTFSQTAPTATTFVEGTDFATMEYSGSGTVVDGVVVNIGLVLPPTATPSSASGCDPATFPAATGPGQVALIQRGTCTFFEKAVNAEAAGYAAAVIFNEGNPDRTDLLFGTLGLPVPIPVLGTTFALGNTLAQPGTRVSISTSTLVTPVTTVNLLAETGGRADRTVVVGAHLDSVAAGPGFNDNGTGSATILEIAEAMAASGTTPRNQVRFAFWGAEEAGLVGSTHYVAGLSPRQLKNIAVNLNFDMVGSPNFARFVYDGDGSDGTAGPNGSGTIEGVFNSYLDGQGLAYESTAFDGRSDYGPFIAVGIPAGGLFTGAEGIKDTEQVALYGGVAGAAFDPCYHQACDSSDPLADGADAVTYAAIAAAYPGQLDGNVNTTALDQMSDAAAHSVLTFAMTTSAVNGTDKASSKAASMDFLGSHLRR